MNMNFKRIAGLLAVLALASCQKEESTPSPAAKVKMTVIAETPSAKTFIAKDGQGVIRANWDHGDKLGIIVDQPEPGTSTLNGVLENSASSGLSSNFGGEVEMTAGSHTLYAFYPSSAFYSVYANGTVGMNVATTQHPRVSSFDPSADILVGKPYDINVTTSAVTITDMRFARVLAIVKIFLKGDTAMKAYGDRISSARLEAPVTLTGRTKVDPNDASLGGWTIQNTEVSAVYDDPQDCPELGTDAIYVLVTPQVISSGTELSLEVYSDNHYITKSITLPQDVVFQAGHITTLNVSITDDNCQDWEIFRQRDDIYASLLTATSTSYMPFSNLAVVSNARYAGTTARNGDAIQLKSKDSVSGIVSTTSGGYARKVEVEWGSNTVSGRTLEVYGSNEAYTSATNLYNTSTRGTLLGSIVYGTSSSLEIHDNYKYIGVKSSSGALYLDKLSIVWRTDDTTPTCEDPEIGFNSNVVTISTETSGASIYYTLDGSDPGTSSTMYTDAFPISESVTVKAIAVKDGYYDSNIVSRLCEYDSGGSSSEAALGQPWLELPGAPTDASMYCVSHRAIMDGLSQRNFTYLYDPAMYTSYWVAYPICSDHLGTGRSGSWGYDKLIPESVQTDVSSGYGVNVSTPNYANNTYSRGHQVPNADRSGVSTMQSQTYIATNCTPQIQNGFNGGIWNQLEDGVRGAVPASDTLYVVTGACFEKVGESKSITYITNKNDSKSLPVPNYYWKVLLKVSRSAGVITSASAIGFWLPHEDLKGKSYSSYCVSVNQIEEWTGFDFFVNLRTAGSEEMESEAESNTSWSDFRNF